MTKNCLLVDFGSTFTKITGVDLEKEVIIGTTKSLTTVNSTIIDGYQKALKQLIQNTKKPYRTFQEKLICSSAHGGFQMAAIGLTANLTTEAAKRAALGAGTRILKAYDMKLSKTDIKEIDNLSPDVILLSGGTDGGNTSYILHNATQLNLLNKNIPIVVAGNKQAQTEISTILEKGKQHYTITENVMPKLNLLNVEPTRKVLRNLFMHKIVMAKGFDDIQKLVAPILMPTPTAVLTAANYLSQGFGDEKGVGDLMIVDVGGATTDIHSIATGKPTQSQTFTEGLQEPFRKRTVEGDLGMRFSALSLYESYGKDKLLSYLSADFGYDLKKACEKRLLKPNFISHSNEDKLIDDALAKTAIDLAISRHVGTTRRETTPNRTIYFQTGKDLTKIKTVVGTGGILVHNPNPNQLLKACLQDKKKLKVLKPQQPDFYLDKSYILSAMGLLATRYPEISIRMMKKYILPL